MDFYSKRFMIKEIKRRKPIKQLTTYDYLSIKQSSLVEEMFEPQNECIQFNRV